MTPSALLVGLVAGLTSALLFVGLVFQSPGAVGLSFAAPIPILLASLGWGSPIGFVAAAVSAVIVGLAVWSPQAGVLVLASTTLPGAVIGHLAGLARPSAERGARAAAMPQTAGDGLDWYPLSRILMAIAAMAAVACLFFGWLIEYDPETIMPAVIEALRQQGSLDLRLASDEELRRIAGFFVRVIPFLQPAILVLTLVVCFYIAGAIARLSGRLPRPRDDIPSAAGLPKAALPVFAAGLAGSFLGGVPGSAAAVVAGSFATAFTLVGLAVIHRRTRGRRARAFVLFSTYVAILLLSFPAVPLVMVLGLFETARQPAGLNPRT